MATPLTTPLQVRSIAHRMAVGPTLTAVIAEAIHKGEPSEPREPTLEELRALADRGAFEPQGLEQHAVGPDQVIARDLLCRRCFERPVVQFGLRDVKPAHQRWRPDAVCDACLTTPETPAPNAEAARRADALARLDVWEKYVDASLATLELHGSPEDRALQAGTFARLRAWVALGERHGPGAVTAINCFFGVPGAAKTHAAWAVAKHAAVELGWEVRVELFSDVVAYLRGTWGDGDGDRTPEAQRLRRYVDVDLLVLDEVSDHALPAKQLQAHLYQLIVARENRRRPTIFTTNARGDALRLLLGAPITSRVTGSDGWWDFGTADFRTEQFRRARLRA